MSFLDNAKKLAEEARKMAGEHPKAADKLLNEAEKIADQQTGGKYHDQIGKIGDKVDEQLDSGQPGRQPHEQRD
jgi:hypothetical protein